MLKTMNIQFNQGNAYQTAKAKGLIPQSILERMKPDSYVTLDCVYALTVNLINIIE